MENQLNEYLKNISSNAERPQANAFDNYVGIISKLENAIAKDAQTVNVLMQNGIISKNQGRNLISQLADKLGKINMYKDSNSESSFVKPISDETFQKIPDETIDYLELFSKDNPEFFKGEGRNAVFNYIKDLNMDKDEIAQIAKLIETLENSAVDGYMRKTAHEKSLNDENAIAKSKLTSYAQNTNAGNNFDRIFTREDIGNMDGDEFNKNELLIMEQVKKGLIK